MCCDTAQALGLMVVSMCCDTAQAKAVFFSVKFVRSHEARAGDCCDYFSSLPPHDRELFGFPAPAAGFRPLISSTARP